ncbi:MULTISPECIES: hypothetical protein [unclassified Arthrobacter]|uniref:hypothetical protein n=1 Tax=unclassified Arthrobacter TaxID=235627 RepID=UPI0027D82EB3|nr:MULTISPECIES: hypothetical protein [unclassified Arthrobacter]
MIAWSHDCGSSRLCHSGSPNAPEHPAPKTALTGHLNAHDLLGVMDLGAPETEYDAEMEDFARLIAERETITPDVVATVWHRWFGNSAGEAAGEPEPPTPAMEALAADFQAVAEHFTQTA